MSKLIEVVPNFSEGRDRSVIDYICGAIEKHDGAKIVHCDMGYDANRTVITFVAEQDIVGDVAFDAIKAASERIDMRCHKGEHPRIGATDVMPFVPLQGSTIEEAVAISRKVAERVVNELSIKVYCYEESRFDVHKQNLFECRKGEYEGIEERLKMAGWQSDFDGGDQYDLVTAKSGITVIGAREFLLAVNFNLSTSDVHVAKKIAKLVRNSGYLVDRERVRGALSGAKAIGWYMEDYGFAQVSMNIVDINKTSLHEAFIEVSRVAHECGCCVTGTEIIGMLPKVVMVDAGRYFASDQIARSEMELIELAAKKMNFDQITPFVASRRILELMI